MEALTLARAQVPRLRLLAGNVTVTSSAIPFRRAAGKYWGDWIIETGRVPFEQVGLYLAACDVLVLPMFIDNISNNARWPSKLNDFLASGRPIVATRVGEVEPLFQHEIGVATNDDPQSLANGIIQIAQNPEQAKYFGQKARALAEGELNWATLVERLEAFYKRVRDSKLSHSN